MSVVPKGPHILRKHYDEAEDDEEAEYKSTAFWHAWLTRAFGDWDKYEVSAEFSPDETRRRVDLVVKRYDADHDTLYALLWVECKRPIETAGQVEIQGLDAALRHMEADDLQFIYVMTTIGVSFRTWIVKSDSKRLLPLHGSPVHGDRNEYIDADSNNAYVLTQTVQRVKTQEPLRHAPIVPSQPATDIALPGLQVYTQPPQSSVQATYVQQQLSTQQAGPSTSTQPSTPQMVWEEVKVTRKPHAFRADEYLFKDARGHIRSTGRDEWTDVDAYGRSARVYRGKRTGYITYEWPE